MQSARLLLKALPPAFGIIFLTVSLDCKPAFAEAPKEPKEGMDKVWADFWDDCYDLNLPYFQGRIKKFIGLLKSGDTWQKTMELEKVNIDHVTKETCKKWAEDPNGDAPLREFIEKYSQVASTAVDLKGKIVNEIGPQMDGWWAVEEKELQPYGFKFEEFPCGKAFKRTQKIIGEHLLALENKFKVIQEKCPKAADEIIAKSLKDGTKAKTTTYGQGSGKVVPTGKSKNGASDISGVKDAQKKAAEGEAILQNQNQDAMDKNKKKGQ